MMKDRRAVRSEILAAAHRLVEGAWMRQGEDTATVPLRDLLALADALSIPVGDNIRHGQRKLG